MPSLKLACIFLASGFSKRFGSNKLLADFRGKPLVDVVLDNHPSELFNCTLVVTRYAQVAASAAERRFGVVENLTATDDPAVTIRLGLDALPAGMDGCMFSVCDQPLLSAHSISALVCAFRAFPDGIVALSYGGRRGNPVIFPAPLFGELSALEPGQGGTAVIAKHPSLLHLVQAEDSRELSDIDCPADLQLLRN